MDETSINEEFLRLVYTHFIYKNTTIKQIEDVLKKGADINTKSNGKTMLQ
jgi:hypothetical protein